ncbi:hypothetical protein DFH09DRAFT_1412788 [Mycena vulgaris]|nr:hypothetical protein DFH09DRAFT_1412788 [Mycena vulgaris]
MKAWIYEEIESSSRLRVKQPEHLKALTKMELSRHSLAVERRRWKERGKKIVPCLCYIYVEDPAYAMFQFKIPGVAATFPNALQLLRGLLPIRVVTPSRKLGYNVLKMFDSTPMLLVDEPAAAF